MEQITVDNYTSKCVMEINGKNKDIIFCKNDYDITFVYIDNEMVCIYAPEHTNPDIIKDIKRLYKDKCIPVIVMGNFHEIPFSYGIIIGMQNSNLLDGE